MKVRDIISERLDYKQTRNWGADDWLNYLNGEIQNGEIYKPDFNDAKSTINRRIENGARDISSKYYLGQYGNDDPLRDQLNDLYWSQPSGTSGLKKLEKVAQKSPDSAYKKQMLDLVKSWSPVRDALEQLKPMVVNAVKKREQKAQAAASEKQTQEGASEALIRALAPNRESYIEYARKMSENTINGYKTKLAKAGGVDGIAPKPDRSQLKTDPEAYEKASKVRGFWEMIDKTAEADWIRRDVQGAADSYDEWTYKLVQKIGKPVISADVKGDPWTKSTISVETNDGEHQVWYTKQIVNYSKFGKPFYQFPTRRAK